MATEKMLKNANELKALFDERYDDAFMQSHTRPNIAWWEGYSAGVNWARNTLNDAPTVDAVPMADIKLHHIIIDNEGVPETKIQIGDKYFVLRTDPVDVREVVHGRWIFPTKINGRTFNIPHCSVCNGVPPGVDKHTKYCAHCGAQMDKESEDSCEQDSI